MTTMNASLTLVVETCCKCGIAFAMPHDWQAERRRLRDTFHCPAGHGQRYIGETDEQRKIRQLEAERSRLEQRERVEREAREHAQRRLAATKGVLTRTKNRIAAGTCPCCDKTFKHLTRHMADAHPDYAVEGGEG